MRLVLLGGVHGVGKTTLLESVRLAACVVNIQVAVHLAGVQGSGGRSRVSLLRPLLLRSPCRISCCHGQPLHLVYLERTTEVPAWWSQSALTF